MTGNEDIDDDIEEIDEDGSIVEDSGIEEIIISPKGKDTTKVVPAKRVAEQLNQLLLKGRESQAKLRNIPLKDYNELVNVLSGKIADAEITPIYYDPDTLQSTVDRNGDKKPFAIKMKIPFTSEETEGISREEWNKRYVSMFKDPTTTLGDRFETVVAEPTIRDAIDKKLAGNVEKFDNSIKTADINAKIESERWKDVVSDIIDKVPDMNWDRKTIKAEIQRLENGLAPLEVDRIIRRSNPNIKISKRQMQREANAAEFEGSIKKKIDALKVQIGELKEREYRKRWGMDNIVLYLVPTEKFEFCKMLNGQKRNVAVILRNAIREIEFDPSHNELKTQLIRLRDSTFSNAKSLLKIKEVQASIDKQNKLDRVAYEELVSSMYDITQLEDKFKKSYASTSDLKLTRLYKKLARIGNAVRERSQATKLKFQDIIDSKVSLSNYKVLDSQIKINDMIHKERIALQTKLDYYNSILDQLSSTQGESVENRVKIANPNKSPESEQNQPYYTTLLDAKKPRFDIKKPREQLAGEEEIDQVDVEYTDFDPELLNVQIERITKRINTLNRIEKEQGISDLTTYKTFQILGDTFDKTNRVNSALADVRKRICDPYRTNHPNIEYDQEVEEELKEERKEKESVLRRAFDLAYPSEKGAFYSDEEQAQMIEDANRKASGKVEVNEI